MTVGLIVARGVWSQYYAAPTPGSPGTPFTNQNYQPYSNYHRDQVHNYRYGGASARNYTIDRYFYHRPTISPYLNLTRRSGGYVNNYYSYVKPEVERRSQAMAPNRPTPMPKAPTQNRVTPYYGHWYQPR